MYKVDRRGVMDVLHEGAIIHLCADGYLHRQRPRGLRVARLPGTGVLASSHQALAGVHTRRHDL